MCCYRKPSICLPCLAERAFGKLKDAYMVIATPAGRLERTVKALKALKESSVQVLRKKRKGVIQKPSIIPDTSS